MKKRFDSIATVLLIVASALVIWKNWPVDTNTPLPTTPFMVGDSAIAGAETAPVAVFEFSDFQCPFCAQFAAEVKPVLRAKFVDTGKVQWIFRHFPLQSRHPFAFGAAQAAECAREQGQFWPMHDLLFRNQKNLSPDELRTFSHGMQLDSRKFESCMSDRSKESVEADLAFARKAMIRGTPAFFIGRKLADGTVAIKARLSGSVDVHAFEAEIQAVLSPWTYAHWALAGIGVLVAVVLVRLAVRRWSGPTA